MSQAWQAEIKQELQALSEIGQKRALQQADQAQTPWVSIEGRRLLNLASNNYLGLAGEARLKQAAQAAVAAYGAGATASRLIVGNHPVYQQAERTLVDWKQAEAGLILHSGYTANVGIISALVGRNDLVFSDKLNHASIVDGIILSRAEHKRYRHNDLNHLENLLKKSAPDKRKLIVTDSVFSMDGDMAQLEGLITLKERYHAILMVDEAHSSGVFGETGAGPVHHLNLQGKVDIQMGTFSKALGCYGAYVVGERWLMDYLVNKMRSFIFSTALPPAVLGAAKEAMKLVQAEPARRQQLQQQARAFCTALSQAGFDIGNSETQIVPIVIGENQQTLRFSQRLQEEGIAAIAVRPPTVPKNQARIRFALMATHQPQEIHEAVETITKVGRELGVIS